MPLYKKPVSRRDFLKLAGLGLGALALPPLGSRLERPGYILKSQLPTYPDAILYGRNCTADTNFSGGKIELKARPDVDSALVRWVYRDEVLPWLSEVLADNLDYANPNQQRWVITPEGYIRSAYLQPCKNIPNTPLTALPTGSSGFWAEVTVPYVDLILDNAAPVSGWMRDHIAYDLAPRLYYSQVMWVDDIRTTSDGVVQYHINERYGNPGDLFWAEGAGFRPLTDDDISPIHPDVDPAIKKVVVNITYQTLSCMEGEKEVYFCRVSTGIAENSTPLGDEQAIWRKMISVRMSANSQGASYDLPGISWATFFNGSGVAIHAATSHNDFGAVRSHGCVNCKPEDAKWVFRWTLPQVPMEPGDVKWSDWQTGSTHVSVKDFV